MELCKRYGLPNIIDLQHGTTEAATTVTADMPAKTRQEIERRVDILRATDGAHVDVY